MKPRKPKRKKKSRDEIRKAEKEWVQQQGGKPQCGFVQPWRNGGRSVYGR